MSSRFQMALVTRVVETGDLRPLRIWGISHQDLTDEYAKLALEYIELHYKENGVVPRKQTIRERCGQSIHLEDTGGEDLEVLCAEVAEEIAESRYRQIQLDSQELLDKYGPIEASSRLQRQFMTLASSFGRTETHVLGSRADIDFAALTSDAEIERIVPYVWPTLQLATAGAHSGEFIVLYGRRKNAKTWGLIEEAEYATREGHKVVFVTPEMTERQIARRTYAIRARFPYHAMKTKSLFNMGDHRAAENQMHLRKVICSFLDSSNFIIYDPKDEEVDLDINIIEGLIQEHRPDLLIIDQFHYIRSSHDPKKELRHQLGDTSRRLKKFSRIYDLPIMVSTQSNRDGFIAESDQIEQIADIVLWVEFDKDRGVRFYKVIAAREYDIEGWACFSEFCTKLHEVPPDHHLLKESSSKKRTRRRNPRQKKLRGRK